ncbi:hypothetical protein R1sor_025555 [Riccia sorocarpa]|uniref:starch synthase n=1 Tax=Riccia sorocarpa TaxID=122646 RepID=A0ABD3GBQ1_9MARC
MPWDFWSNLLLRIDALMLGKQLSLEDGLELRIMAWRREARIRDAYVAVHNEKDGEVAAGLTQLTRQKKKPGYHVVHIAAEMAPVAKVGGLGDVVTGLGRALQKKGHLVEIILPKYDCIDYSRIKNLKYQFSADDLSGKYANKAALRARLGLAPADASEDKPLREFERIARDSEQHPHIRLILKYDGGLTFHLRSVRNMIAVRMGVFRLLGRRED